ncbi:MAG: tRNA (adenosine(37)-N6)-threonylcarbamoyltransferase complex ATPase subunit type 1 TsaE, partial [Nitrospirota bacterium]
PADIEGIGFFEFPGSGAAMVEWPQRAGDELPIERLEVLFEHMGGDKRKITVTAVGTIYEKFLEAICPPR